MTEEEIVKAKLRAKGVSEKAIKYIIEYYRDLCPISDCWFKGAQEAFKWLNGKGRSLRMTKEFKDLPIKLDNAFWELLDILVTRGVLNPKDRKTITEAYEE